MTIQLYDSESTTSILLHSIFPDLVLLNDHILDLYANNTTRCRVLEEILGFSC